MRFKRMIAVFLSAAIYMTAGAAAAELPQDAVEAETTAVTTETAAERDLTQDLPQARAVVSAAKTTHAFQLNGKAVTNPQAYLINKYNYFKLRDVAYLLRNSTAEFEVGWEKSTNVITLTTGKNYTAVGGELNTKALSSAAGKPTTAIVKVNGKKVSFDGYIINGNNYYKIADMASALGFTADYDVPSRTVTLKTPTPAPTPASFTTGVYRVNVHSALTVRSGPGKTYSEVGEYAKDALVIVDKLSNGWAHLLDSAGGSGRYCSADYLVRVRDYNAAVDKQTEPTVSKPSTPSTPSTPVTPDEPTTPTEPTTPDTSVETFTSGVYRVTVGSELSVRSIPSTSGTLVGVLKNGAEIAVDSISNGWAHIMDNSSGSGRYCSAAYLTRVRDYVSGDEDNDPIQPPRTSHIDGVKTVIIDPGHGGSDVGANNGGSIDEKHVNLYVAQYLKQYLEAAGAKVIMVRNTLEEGSELTLRGAVMEQYASSADLFFSIHHNAANTTARGAEILAQIADKNGGPTKILAQALLDEYEKLGVPIRQIVFREGSHGDYYYTNRAAAALNIPALTSEFCFIDNEEDQKFIDSEEDWQKQARAQCNAILYYFTQVQY